MRGMLLAAWVLALSLMPTGWASAQETTHEILVGYNSEQDRRAAEKELAGAKDQLKVRGQRLESLQVEAIGAKELKLRVGLPQAIRAEIARTPSLEAAIIQGLADQLRKADKRVAYAHPNWIVRMAPPAARAAAPPVGARSTAVAPRKPNKRSARRAKAHKAHVARRRSRTVRRQRPRWPVISSHTPCLDRVWREASWLFHRW